jgi:hypothetical protein
VKDEKSKAAPRNGVFEPGAQFGQFALAFDETTMSIVKARLC